MGQNYFCESGPAWWHNSSIDNVVLSTQTVTPCVMDRVVVPIANVVYSTHNHGSMYNCLPLQLMRLKFGFVGIYNEDSPIQLMKLYVK